MKSTKTCLIIYERRNSKKYSNLTFKIYLCTGYINSMFMGATSTYDSFKTGTYFHIKEEKLYNYSARKYSTA